MCSDNQERENAFMHAKERRQMDTPEHFSIPYICGESFKFSRIYELQRHGLKRVSNKEVP